MQKGYGGNETASRMFQLFDQDGDGIVLINEWENVYEELAFESKMRNNIQN